MCQNVLHSDLKSRNVMLKSRDNGGVIPKVWGGCEC